MRSRDRNVIMKVPKIHRFDWHYFKIDRVWHSMIVVVEMADNQYIILYSDFICSIRLTLVYAFLQFETIRIYIHKQFIVVRILNDEIVHV